jgi:hypothetical protein
MFDDGRSTRNINGVIKNLIAEENDMTGHGAPFAGICSWLDRITTQSRFDGFNHENNLLKNAKTPAGNDQGLMVGKLCLNDYQGELPQRGSIGC